MTTTRIEDELAHRNSFNEIVFRGSRMGWLAWLEARPVVQLIFLLRFLSGAVIATGAASTLPWKSVAISASCWLATTTAVYLVNGISDVPEDSVNGSSRPIARGALPQRTAATVAAMTAAIGLVGAALIGDGWTLLFTLAMLSLGWAYSMGPQPLKRCMTGFTCTVVAGGMLTYLDGWNSVGGTMHLDL